MLDLTDNAKPEEKELNRTQEGGLPLMILFPAKPDKPGVVMNGSISPSDALKALKYSIKHSK